MTFQEFLNSTNYSASYAATSILYQPESRAATMAKALGYTPDDDEKKKLRYIASGQKTVKELFESNALAS